MRTSGGGTQLVYDFRCQLAPADTARTVQLERPAVTVKPRIVNPIRRLPSSFPLPVDLGERNQPQPYNSLRVRFARSEAAQFSELDGLTTSQTTVLH